MGKARGAEKMRAWQSEFEKSITKDLERKSNSKQWNRRREKNEGRKKWKASSRTVNICSLHASNSFIFPFIIFHTLSIYSTPP